MTLGFLACGSLVVLLGSLGSRYVWPSRALRLLVPAWHYLSRSRALSLAGIALLSAATCTALAYRGFRYAPDAHDEFCYLLAADTFAHGRLTNPTPLCWIHFESIHQIVQPSYMSKYPPGQGLMLALGIIVFGHPMLGVYLSFVLACTAICWMLQAWLPSRWALIGGALSILMLATTTWPNSYWGGNIAALGGALLFGALRRLIGRPRLLPALAMGLGLALLANTRPYEGLIVSVPTCVVLLGFMIRQGQLTRAVFWAKVAIPIGLILGMTAGWMAWYNYRVTGDPLRLAYQVHDATYSATPTFLWQSPKVELPNYHHASMRGYYVDFELPRFVKKSLWCGFNSSLATKLFNFAKFFITPLLIVPLMALARYNRRPWWFFAAGVCFLELLGLSQTLYLAPHYAAPITGLMMALNMQAIRNLRLWKFRGGRAGRFYVIGVFAVLFVGFVIYCIQPPPVSPRAKVADDLAKLPGNHLVLVRYGPTHEAENEWVYNGADLDGELIVWARDLGSVQNQRVVDYYRDREIWLLTIDKTEICLMPYARP